MQISSAARSNAGKAHNAHNAHNAPKAGNARNAPNSLQAQYQHIDIDILQKVSGSVSYVEWHAESESEV